MLSVFNCSIVTPKTHSTAIHFCIELYSVPEMLSLSGFDL